MHSYRLTALALLAGTPACAATLTVGHGQAFATIAAAVAASADGDTIQVASGTYVNDFSEITTKIALVAVGGRVTMQATDDIPNEKAILITDTDISITGFTFTGAHVTPAEGQNGAGIRYQGGNLAVAQCYFHDNQEGLLADADSAGSVTISASEFAHNGDATGPGAGYTHNLYVGAVGRLNVANSYFHDAVVGHEIKSRALVTIINNTRVVDGPTGTGSYSIDLPNGGKASIVNTQIEKGPYSENGILVTFGEEGAIAASSLSLQGTVIENDLRVHIPLGVRNVSAATATLANTRIYGLTAGQVVAGLATQTVTVFLTSEPRISTRHPF
jgi:hypothetical protein